MHSKEVIIDTNFLMIPFQFNVDIIEELERKLPAYDLIVPSCVVDELYGLSNNEHGKTRLNAGMALKLVKNSPVEIREVALSENETVDDALLRISDVIATNDAQLKKRAKEHGISVVYLRQKKYIAIDGILS